MVTVTFLRMRHSGTGGLAPQNAAVPLTHLPDADPAASGHFSKMSWLAIEPQISCGLVALGCPGPVYWHRWWLSRSSAAELQRQPSAAHWLGEVCWLQPSSPVHVPLCLLHHHCDDDCSTLKRSAHVLVFASHAQFRVFEQVSPVVYAWHRSTYFCTLKGCVCGQGLVRFPMLSHEHSSWAAQVCCFSCAAQCSAWLHTEEAQHCQLMEGHQTIMVLSHLSTTLMALAWVEMLIPVVNRLHQTQATVEVRAVVQKQGQEVVHETTNAPEKESA